MLQGNTDSAFHILLTVASAQLIVPRCFLDRRLGADLFFEQHRRNCRNWPVPVARRPEFSC